jgi:micrococcal nuclease
MARGQACASEYERKGQTLGLITDDKLALMVAKQDISKFSNIINLNLPQSLLFLHCKVYFYYSERRINGTHLPQITVEKDKLK